MTPRDPDEVEQTLLPGAPAKAPPARPAKPAAETPGPFDATIETPVAAPPDPGETLPSIPPVPGPAPVPRTPAKDAGSEPTSDGVEATLLPTSAPTGAGSRTGIADPDATGAHSADPDVTLPTPVGRTLASGGSSGPLGSDTAPLSSFPSVGPRPGASPSATGTMIGRFALKGLHASGGLGEVFTARDTELNREVAVKRIKSHYADDPGSRSRFLSEATLTARLDHPGVVPVFGLVNDVRGRPCYAMRFIRGETLKDEIDRYHGGRKAEDKGQRTEKTDKAGTAERAPGSAAAPEGPVTEVPRSVAFRHLLARFIATCQAIAYAHSRNIIHRDIKPANIMVGTFGETLVVDWGLAKSLDDGPDFDRIMKAAAEVGYRHDPEATDLPSHMTSAGTAVGTPAYMAPEQAAGEVEKVGPRADVYALGATLFVILTGKPPVAGKTTLEVLDRVRSGAYEPAATVNPECPKPLDAIARKAMAVRPEDRYTTALDLSADVERWLSDEPVSCYRDPFFARLARWARRHPARVATGVSLLLAGVLGAAGVAWAIHEGEKQTAAQRDRAQEAEKQTADERDKVKLAQAGTIAANHALENKNAELQTEKGKVEVARNAAIKRYDKAVRAYGVLVHDVDKQLADSVGTDDLRKRLLSSATDGLQQLIADEKRYGADRTLVAAYRQMGEVYQLLGDTAKAHEHFQLAVDRAREVRDEAAPGDKRAADRDLGRSLDKLAGIHLQAGKTDAALKAVTEAIDLFTALVADKADPEAQADLAGARSRRSTILMERGDTRGALEDGTAALAARKELAPAKLAAGAPAADVERQRAYATSLDAVAGLQLRTGRTEAALKNAGDSLALRVELDRMFPNHPDAPRERADAHARLGEVHFERGHMTAAALEYRAGADRLKKLLARDGKSAGARSDLAQMLGRLGHAQLRLGEVEDALANTKTGRDVALDLQTADPASVKALRDLALARERYGDALLAAAQFDDGIAEYAASEKILRPLCDADGESARAKLELARALERLGDGFTAKDEMSRALGAFTESVKVREQVVAKDAGSATAKRDLALGLYKVAGAHCGLTQPGRAEPFANRATDLFLELANADPESHQARRDLALAYAKWGQILVAGGHRTGALVVWQSSLDRCEQLAKVDANNVQAMEDEAAAWERLAGFYAAVGNTDRAIATSRTAVEQWTAISKGVDAKTKAGRRRLALAMLRCGDINTEVRQFAAARAWYEKAGKEAAEPGDPLLAPIAERVAVQKEYLKAVETGLANVRNVKTFPEPVQIAALRTIIKLALRAGDPTTAYVAATQLAKVAKTAADKFAVARALAGCAWAGGGDPKVKQEYAEEAVKALKDAIAAGFRDADSLTEPEWDAVRTRVKELDEVRIALEELAAEGK